MEFTIKLLFFEFHSRDEINFQNTEIESFVELLLE